MTNQSIEIEEAEEPPTLQIQLDISIIIRPLTMFFLKVHTLSHKSHCFLYFIYLIFIFMENRHGDQRFLVYMDT